MTGAQGATRRTLLRAVVGALVLGSVDGARRRMPVARPSSGASDRRLAELGRSLVRARPSLARALLRYACRASRSDVRRVLLHPRTIRRETERGDLVVVDGWHLARSEAALCVYLAARDGTGDRPA